MVLKQVSRYGSWRVFNIRLAFLKVTWILLFVMMPRDVGRDATTRQETAHLGIAWMDCADGTGGGEKFCRIWMCWNIGEERVCSNLYDIVHTLPILKVKM